MLSPPFSKECYSEGPVHPYWKDESCLSNKDPACPTPLQGSSTCTPASSVTVWPKKESASPLNLSSPGRPELVGLEQQPCEWLSNSTSPQRYYHLDRCFKNKMAATYQGISAGGHWSAEEAKEHINVLELRAATLALKTFLPPQLPGPKDVHLRIDNTTAVAYINNRGGTLSPVLTAQALELWAVALDAGVSLTAQHIPGIQNVVLFPRILKKIRADQATALVIAPNWAG